MTPLKNDIGFPHEELTQLPDVMFMPHPSTLSLFFLHENRAEVARNIAEILSTVSAHVFVHIKQSATNGATLRGTRASAGGLPGDDIHMQHEKILYRRFGDALSRVLLNQIDSNQEEVYDYPVDRTVYLKFPCWCRLTANEIREFFTGICRDVITMRENIYLRKSKPVVYCHRTPFMVGARKNTLLVELSYCKRISEDLQLSPWDEHSIFERT